MEATKQGKKVTVGCPFCGVLNRIDVSRAAERPKCGSCEKPLLLDRPVMATDDNLARVIRDAEVPVLVDFYADWCGPCKAMAPALDEVARAKMGEALVVKVNTDRSPEMARQYRIGGVPTLILFRQGREIRREVGALPRPRLEALLDGGG